MTNALVPITNAQAPLAVQQRRAQGLATNQNFADGVRDAFPLLSIKGKVFRVRIAGQETAFVDPQTRQAMGALDIVLVNAARQLSKAYYIKGFTEGDLNPPDCWSMDSIRPDPSVANKVSITCVNCPMNAFGSKISDNGKAAKACQDARRLAIVMPHNLNDPEPLVMLLRTPATSLKNLKAYAQLLDRHGFEPNSCITRISFDYNEAYPKLIFNFVAPLTDAEYTKVVEIAEAPTTASMLQAPDFDATISTAPKQADTIGGLVPQTGPVLENPAVVSTVAQRSGPVLDSQTMAEALQETPAQQELPVTTVQTGIGQLSAVGSTMIELPDGKLFDTATGQYVERTQPQTPMAEDDPATIVLPDGKFFNTVTKAFVTGKEKGAKPVGDVAASTPPTKRTRAPAKPKEPVATGQQASTQPSPEKTPPVQQTQAEATGDAQTKSMLEGLVKGAVNNQQSGDSGDNQTAKTVNGHAQDAQVVAAPANLESILSALVPAK